MILRAATLSLALLAGQSARAETCAQLSEPPSIRILVAPSQVMIDRSLAPQEIEAVAAGGTAGRLEAGWSMNGLAAASLASSVEIGTKVLSLPDGSACAGLSSVTVTVGYESPVTVYVSRRYSPGSCEYSAIERHEMEHVAIYARALAEGTGAIRAELDSQVAALLPFAGRTEEEATRGLQETVNEAVRRGTAEIVAHASAANAEIDTPDSYRALQSQCTGW